MRYYIDLKGIGSIMRNPNYSDKEKVLLYIIADHCQFSLNNGKVCQLSYSLIKKWTGWGDHTVQNTIASLVEKGDISYVTEHIKGNRKSTAVVSTGYCRSDSNSTVETAVQGTVVATVNNKQEKQQRNSTIAIDTYSCKCESDCTESSCTVSEDTSFIGVGNEPGGNAEQPDSGIDDIHTFLDSNAGNEKVMGDLLDWAIRNGWFTSDIQVERVVNSTMGDCMEMDLNRRHYIDTFNSLQEKNRLARILAV